jgi:putative nucleotidyltransferase with HDIG domain
MKPSRQDIFDYAKSLVCLPTLDNISETLSLLLAGPRVSFARLSDVIQYDAGLASRVIAVANSAWHNRGIPIVNLKRAMTALGIEEVRDIVICAVFYDSMLKKSGLKSEDISRLWRHSLLVAFASRSLNTMSKSAEKAFTAGLLHDIGKVPLLLVCGYSLAAEQPVDTDVCAFERNEFGADHQEIGAYMAAEWGLPEDYRQVIRTHHEQMAGSPLCEVVRTANTLVTAQTEDKELLEKKKAIEAEANRIIHLFSDPH